MRDSQTIVPHTFAFEDNVVKIKCPPGYYLHYHNQNVIFMRHFESFERSFSGHPRHLHGDVVQRGYQPAHCDFLLPRFMYGQKEQRRFSQILGRVIDEQIAGGPVRMGCIPLFTGDQSARHHT